jgi:hypothetical protein
MNKFGAMKQIFGFNHLEKFHVGYMRSRCPVDLQEEIDSIASKAKSVKANCSPLQIEAAERFTELANREIAELKKLEGEGCSLQKGERL